MKRDGLLLFCVRVGSTVSAKAISVRNSFSANDRRLFQSRAHREIAGAVDPLTWIIGKIYLKNPSLYYKTIILFFSYNVGIKSRACISDFGVIYFLFIDLTPTSRRLDAGLRLRLAKRIDQ